MKSHRKVIYPNFKAILKTISANRLFQFENNLVIQDLNQRQKQIQEFERLENIRKAEIARQKLDEFLDIVNVRREQRIEDRKARVKKQPVNKIS